MTLDPHIYHEIAGTAQNLLIKRQYAGSVAAQNEPQKLVAEILKPLAARLPTQTCLAARKREMYDNIATGWQEVLKNFTRALDITNSSRTSRRMVVNQFWAEHRHCFRNLITALKVPTLLREIENALAD